MDDKALKQMEFHRDTVSRDANSPLHLIREKEMEISGRVLAAKRESEEIVAAARKKAAEAVARAEDEAVALARQREEQVFAQAEAEAEGVRAAAEKEAEKLEAAVAGRLGAAVEYVVEAVTGARR